MLYWTNVVLKKYDILVIW